MFQLNQANLDKIEDLRYKRDLIKDKLKTRYDNYEEKKVVAEDVGNLIKDFYSMTDELYNLGFTYPSTAEYLKPEYWHMSINDLKPISSSELKSSLVRESRSVKIIPTPSPSPVKKINIPSEQSYYIFNLAWTELGITEQEKMISSIKGYFSLVGLEECENNNFNYGKNDEHIIKYKKKCSLEIRNMIVKTAQYMIDSFSLPKVQQNTSVYVNKK